MGLERTSAAITLISATLAGIFIYYSHPISQQLVQWMNHSAAADSNRIVLATVEGTTGVVNLQRLGEESGETQPVFKNERLYNLDQLIVGPGGDAILAFSSGYRLNLISNTDAIIQSYRPKEATAPVLLTLVSGNYQMSSTSIGQKGDLYIAMNGQIFAPENRPAAVDNQIQLNQTQHVDAVLATLKETSAKFAPKPQHLNNQPIAADTVDINGQETLTDSYISRTMQEQASAFRDCQLNSLRDDLTADGSLLFSITINPLGTIDHIGVLEDDIHNKELLDCTRSVIERIQFRHFDGKSMTINYQIDYR